MTMANGLIQPNCHAAAINLAGERKGTAASLTGRKIWIVMTNITPPNSFTVASPAANIFTFGTCPSGGPAVCPGVSSVAFESAAQFYSDGTRWNAAYTNQ